MPCARSRPFRLLVLGSCLSGLAGCWPERTYDQAPLGEDDDADFGADSPPTSTADGDAGLTANDDSAQPEAAPSSGGGANGAEPDAPGVDVDAGIEGPGRMLDQTGNPIHQQLGGYAEWLSTVGTAEERLAADQRLADNLLSWQMPHGGFFKYDLAKYADAWDGTSPRSDWMGADGVELGTIDNDATVRELLFLADVYQRSLDSRYRDGADRALGFLLGMQHEQGGFPQVHPERAGTAYSNYVTFNDDAMARVLVLLLRIANDEPPVDGELFGDERRSAARAAIDRAVDYILKAQLDQDGVKTVWCAQHDPVSYEPREGRSYELPSKSGKESVGIASFLMAEPQTPEIEAAVRAAIAWYERDEVRFEDTAYVSRPSDSTDDTYNPIRPAAGIDMWCRFYELEQDVCFFSGRLPTDSPPGVGKQYDLMEVEPERRYGYQWGGSYGASLLAYARSVGY